MVLDIRGTHGSGKSWIMHQLLKLSKLDCRNITGTAYDKPDQHLGYFLGRWQAFLLGKYDNECGGCDGIKSADEVVRRVRIASSVKMGRDIVINHVLLEGILVAHTFQRYSELATELESKGVPYTFYFLNTPLEVCIERVLARRKQRGQTKEFNPKNVIHDHQQIYTRVFDKCMEAGHTCVELDWENPLPQVLKGLGDAKTN